MSDPNNGPVDPIEPPSVPYTPPSTGKTSPGEPPAPLAGGYGLPTAPTPPAYGMPPAYGTPPAYGQPASGQPGTPAPPRTLSLIGMITGIVGLVGSGVVLIPIVGSIMGLFIPAGAVVLGFLGRKREGNPARAFWLTALITGFIGIGIALLALFAYIAFFTLAGSDSMGTMQFN